MVMWWWWCGDGDLSGGEEVEYLNIFSVWKDSMSLPPCISIIIASEKTGQTASLPSLLLSKKTLATSLTSSALPPSGNFFYVFQQQQNGKDTKILTEHPPQSLITFLTIENNNLDTYSDLSWKRDKVQRNWPMPMEMYSPSHFRPVLRRKAKPEKRFKDKFSEEVYYDLPRTLWPILVKLHPNPSH